MTRTATRPVTFTDRRGRRWAVAFTADNLAVIRDALGLDLVRAATSADPVGAVNALLTTRLEATVEVLCAACEPQVVAAGLTPEQFAAGMADHTVLERGAVAVIEALGRYLPGTTFGRTVARGLPAWRRRN